MVLKADQAKLYDDPGWTKLLFVRPRLFGGVESVFDDPLFFLAGPKGKRDMRVELLATLRRLLTDEKIQLKDGSFPTRCIFAARFAFLEKKLQIDPKQIPAVECPNLATFTKFADYSAVSLVFSNYFADNPASMFGHTLLRLHRARQGSQMGLLDDAANFAAQIEVMNPFTYPFKGLAGMYRGRFALVSYSEKIQEYNNYESRDLWEYELNFSPEELRQLVRVMWEVGYFWMDYFYLDENCSYLMLAILEAAKPELELTSRFNLYAIPSDTVKVTTEQPNLIKKIGFKPSAQTRYLERAQNLNPEETEIFTAALRRYANSFDRAEFESLFTRAACDENCRMHVFDTLIEYIDYKEKKISTTLVHTYAGLRSHVLTERSHIHFPSPPLKYRPERSRPDLGPRSAALEFNTGWTNRGYNNSEFRWRPAFHDLGSSNLGYSDQLQIQILDTIFARDQELNKNYLHHFSPLELTSLGRHELGLSPNSWRFAISHDTQRSARPERDGYSRETLQGGYGGARFWGSLVVYALFDVDAGYSDDPSLYWNFGVGPRVGALWNLSERFKFSIRWDWMKNYGRSSVEREDIVGRFNYFPNTNQEIYAEFRDMDHLYYEGVGYRFYF